MCVFVLSGDHYQFVIKFEYKLLHSHKSISHTKQMNCTHRIKVDETYDLLSRNLTKATILVANSYYSFVMLNVNVFETDHNVRENEYPNTSAFSIHHAELMLYIFGCSRLLFINNGCMCIL